MPQKKSVTKIKRIKPELPGGFRDYPPADAIIRQRLLAKIRKTFEDFGFDPMETPAVEKTTLLTGGEATSDKIVFRVAPAVRGEVKDITRDELSLRFDLTLPLARFMAANPEIPKPFKRYQIGNVWRGERQQAGRYREFLQADIDIVGSSSMEADAEIVAVISRVFKNLGINKFLSKINNRKVLNGLPCWAGFPEKKLWYLLRIIDKKDKIGNEALRKELIKTFKKKVAEKIMQFLAISGDAKQKLLAARELLKESEVSQEGIQELAEIARTLKALGVASENWEIDFGTVRGLGYYTGPVFETVLLASPKSGSVCGGGRYDNLLVHVTGQQIPAVGVSFGVDRLFAALDELGLLKKKQTCVKVLILNLAPELREEYAALASELRQANINTMLSLGDDRAFQAQLAYAVKKEIPYVVIYGEQEEKKGVVRIKDMARKEQREIPKKELVKYFR